MKKSKNKKKKKKQINRLNVPLNPLSSQVNVGTPSISACLIVKNEEQFLENCLNSLKDQVNEIIIVDTGSTDTTVEIAKKYTDKVYFHPWEDSFCKARNQALGYATCDWIFQIDADEEIMSENAPTLHTEIKNAENCDIIYVKIYSSFENGKKTSLHNYGRLFRNNSLIHYKGNIHEQVTGGTKEYFSSIKLWHYGYDVDDEKAQNKFERTAGLLKKEIEKDPENPVHHHNISVSYLSRKMYEEAINEANKAIELSDALNDNSNLYLWSHYIASMGCFCTGRLEEAKKYAEKSLNRNPEHLDSNYMLTVIAFDEGRWDDVIGYGDVFFKIIKDIENKKENITLETSINDGSLVHTIMGHASYFRNSFQEMENYYEKALDEADKRWLTLRKIGNYHMEKSGDLVIAEKYFKQAIKEAPDEKSIWYSLSRLYEKQGLINEEIEALIKVINIGTNDPAIFNRILTLYLNEGMLDEAMEILLGYGDKINISASIFCKTAVLHLEKGQIEPAMKSYMMALEKDNTIFEAWASLGEITLAINKIDDSKTFFEKALSIKNNDILTILNLCDIASREADISKIVEYCDSLLRIAGLPVDRNINSLDDLQEILKEIGSALGNSTNYHNQIAAISERISEINIQTA